MYHPRRWFEFVRKHMAYAICINSVIKHERSHHLFCFSHSIALNPLLNNNNSRSCNLVNQNDWQWSWGRCAHIKAFQIWSKWMICVCKINFWILLTAKPSRYQSLKYEPIDYQMCIFHFLLYGCSRNIEEKKMIININLTFYMQLIDFIEAYKKIKNDDSKLLIQWMEIMCVMTKLIRWYMYRKS